MSGITLVTGGRGFVGNHLVAALCQRGARVRVLDVAPAGPPATTDGRGGGARGPDARAEWVTGSVTDAEAVAGALSGVSTVYHLASIADLWRPDRAIFDAINVEGTRIVLDSARRAGVQRFVQCSSLTTLVSRHAPLGPSTADEATELAPGDLIGDYPQAKRRADLLVEAAAKAGFDASIAMPTEPIGAGDTNITPPTRMILDFINGATPAYIDCTLNFIPVDSLAAGLIATAEHGERGARYLLGGDNIEMSRLLAMLEALTAVAMPTLKLPFAVAYLAGVIDTHCIARMTGKPPKAPLTGVRLAGRRVSFSSDRAARDLGWRAGPVKPALAAMIRWAREEGHIGVPPTGDDTRSVYSI